MDFESDSIASDRLRKAIERNRRKRDKRSSSKDMVIIPEYRSVSKPLVKPKYLKFNFSNLIPRNIKAGLVTAGWLFNAFLLGRLMFSQNGLLDFYAKRDLIAQNNQTLESIKKESKDIAREIEKVKSSPSYQRKLARDHLGVIASDEYLVIFSSAKQELTN